MLFLFHWRDNTEINIKRDYLNNQTKFRLENCKIKVLFFATT